MSVSLTAVRLLGPSAVTDYKVGTALLFRHIKAHIMSNSWGPKDDGKIMPYSGPLARTALKIGISKVLFKIAKLSGLIYNTLLND